MTQHSAGQRSTRGRGAIAGLLAVVLACGAAGVLAAPGAAPGATPDEAPWRFTSDGRVVAVGDVHGDLAALRSLLRAAAVIDADDRWVGGTTVLVSLGDLLDRGPDSRAVMDLLMRLQDEAADAGGRVLVALGNHEQMNLTGDLRYVAPEEFAAFAGAEDDALRARAIEARRAAGLDPAPLRDRPPGWFAHRAAFAPDGRYGAWLLDQHLLLMVDERVFLHGGLSPILLEAGPPDALDGVLRRDLRRLLELATTPPLDAPANGDVDVAQLAVSLADDSIDPPPALRPLAPRLSALGASPVFATHGPLWHRGNATCHPLLETPPLMRVLDALDARGVVVGHTPTPDHRIHERLDGRVHRIDTGMLAARYGGVPRALVLEGDAITVVSPDGTQDAPDVAHAAVDGGRSPERADRMLAEGEIEAIDGERDRVRLRLDDAVAVARVHRLRERDRHHEIAARRLDALLDLGMVPAVAERRLDGRTVLLQMDDGEWIDETRRAAERIAIPNSCAEGHAFDLVRVFDALAGHRRDVDDLSWSVPGLALRLTGHRDAFTRERALPSALPEVPPSVLARLDERTLRDALSALLDGRRMNAVVTRHRALLAASETD